MNARKGLVVPRLGLLDHRGARSPCVLLRDGAQDCAQLSGEGSQRRGSDLIVLASPPYSPQSGRMRVATGRRIRKVQSVLNYLISARGTVRPRWVGGDVEQTIRCPRGSRTQTAATAVLTRSSAARLYCSCGQYLELYGTPTNP